MEKIIEHLPLCSDNEERACASMTIRNVQKNVIKRPCTRLTYKGLKTTHKHNHGPEATYHMMFLNPAMVSVREEYLIYDAVSMISAIGGTLGLCIGISFYNISSLLVEWLEIVLNRVRCDKTNITGPEEAIFDSQRSKPTDDFEQELARIRAKTILELETLGRAYYKKSTMNA